MTCKENSAAYVSGTTPHLAEVSAVIVNKYRHEPCFATSYVLDIGWICGIITKTCGLPSLGDCGACEERQQAREGPSVARRRHAEPGTGEGPRYEVLRQRVLRRERHRAGQIRDAASRIGRECLGRQCDRGIRRVAANLLPGQNQLRGIWDRRSGAQEAGSAWPSQAARPGAGVYPRAACRGRAHSGARTGEADPEEIRSCCAPKDDRTGDRGKKNGALTPGDGKGSERLAEVVSQYEALRSAALGHPLAPEARGGLILFLRRGMWAWARVMAVPRPSVQQEPKYRTSLSLASDESTAVIHVFAAMAMNAEHRGARP